MNNRFKFRVWFAPDWQDPEMIYEAEHTYDNRCRNKGSFHHESFGEILEDKDCIVMQSTGLKDKNGKLIYEGDIVKFKDKIKINGSKTHISTVEYNERFNTYMYHAECMGLYTVNKVQNEQFDIEVIGNIYEKKEFKNERNDINNYSDSDACLRESDKQSK